MKIALIGYEANIKNRVGSNQYAFELLWALWRVDKKNEYVVFLPNSPCDDLPPSRQNWQYKIVGPKKLWNFFGLPWSLKKEKPSPEVVFVPGHYAPPFVGLPLVIAVMDLGYLRFPQHFTKPIYFKLKYWTDFSLKKAAKILAISQATKKDIVRFYKISPQKIVVAPAAMRKRKAKIKKEEVEAVKKKYKIDKDYVLFLGTLKPSKNIEGLIKAFFLVVRDQRSGIGGQIVNWSPVTGHRSPIILVIAGRKGWLYEKVFEKVKDLGLEKKVIFTDFVSEKEMLPLMAGASVFVLPSFWEGFGIPVLEAMSLGVPVVASNVGSLPEVVGGAGILVDPYKPQDIALGIKKALENKEKLVKLGYQQVKKFSWEKTAKKVVEVLEEVGGKNA